MAVTQPNITIDLTVNSGCSGLSLTDNTGEYSASNTGGYGLPDGPTVNDVDTVTIVLTYNSLSNFITYVFTVVNGTITAATLAIAAGTPADILTELPSTDWPFTDPFDLTDGYGVTLPTFEDEIFSVSYTIEGEVGADPFEFEAVKNKSVTCSTECCIQKKFLALDPACCCGSEQQDVALYGEALLKKIEYATAFGELDNALAALAKATALCSTNECGC